MRAATEGASRKDFTCCKFDRFEKSLRKSFAKSLRKVLAIKLAASSFRKDDTRRTRGLLQPARHESMKNVRFMFRGMRVEETQTLAGLRLDMEDGDGIEVHGVF